MTLLCFPNRLTRSKALKYKFAATINDIQSVVALFLCNKKKCVSGDSSGVRQKAFRESTACFDVDANAGVLHEASRRISREGHCQTV